MGKAQHIITSLLAVAGGLLLTSCIEESTVIKVNRDGSGIIHERSYSGATDDVIPFPSLSTRNEDKPEAAEVETKLPAVVAIKEHARTLGEGVTFKSVKESTNKKGWKGYEIIYEFDDINTVRYLRKSWKTDDDAEDATKKDKDEKKDEFTASFAMKDGELSIRMEREGLKGAEAAPRQDAESPTIDPYADTTGPAPAEINLTSNAMNETMLKAMTKGMRMGIFLQVDGEIAKTNAAHRNGNLITLFNADLGTLFENEGGVGALDQLNKVDRVEFQELADQLDGLDVDLQEPIVVRFK